MTPITNKKQMYDLLMAGAFGNTAPQWLSLEEWEASDESARYAMWGVRTLVAGGPCRLMCPREEVRETCLRPDFLAAGINISLMIDAIVNVTLWADVFDTLTGLIVYGIEYPPKGGSWRKLMPLEGRQWTGIEARMLLARHLNPSSLADLWALLELYPGHIVELSACERCVGTILGRNAVVWECRCSTGEYERWT